MSMRAALAVVAIAAIAVAAAAPVVSQGPARAAFAPPTTAATTTVPMQLVAPTTSTSTTTTVASVLTPPPRPTTTTTDGPSLAQPTTPTTTQPSVQIATTTTTPTLAQQPATTTATTIATAALDPSASDEPVSLGEWSSDPDDWSDEVLAYLAAEGFDLDAAGQTAGGAGTPGQLLSNEGCAVNCITSGRTWAVGVGAYLEVTTSVPAYITIDILDAGFKASSTLEKVWGATWPHLEPDTTYQALARAVDGNGNIAVAAGEFTTLRRFAQVWLEPTAFTLWNPSDVDPWADYEWHYHAFAWLDDQTASKNAASPEALHFSLLTGEIDPSVIDVVYKGVIENVNGDCGNQAIGWSFSDLPEEVSGGWPACFGFYAAVANGIELDGYPANATSWTGHEFTFPLSTFWGTPQQAPAYVAVDVTVEVWYE